TRRSGRFTRARRTCSCRRSRSRSWVSAVSRPAGSFTAILAVAWLLFAAAVYLPDVGRGFVKDDFGWVGAGRAALHAPSDALVPAAPGFYRPAGAFTFAADYLLHDVRPRGYGFTNLALYLLCIGAISLLGRAAG